VAAEVRTRLEGIARPTGYDLVVAGNFEEQQKAFRELSVSLLLALLLVYMVLASQYESLSDPLLVMLTVPLAAAGVLLTLVLTNTTLNMQSGIGCLMLGGIGIGEGADAQAPLARVVVGGLSVSALVTLGLIPVAYSLVHRERE
jgi:HAE1 family hydrophobic/amphiphilic exporter-1